MADGAATSDDRSTALVAGGTAVFEDPAAASRTRRGSRVGAFVRTFGKALLFLLVLFLVWEGLKAIGGVPWRLKNVLGLGFDVTHFPPLRIHILSDTSLPHLWEIAGDLVEPYRQRSPISLAQYLGTAALYTWQEAIVGFIAGALLGLLLASLFVHSRLMERAFVPYVIASQTVPIVALAPMIVFAFGQSIASVVVIATYLTFFPVTIAGIRGLQAPDPRALELMRSYAASRWKIYWKLRLPAALPYLFTALKISATASVVGAIIGEGPGGIPNGLGRALIAFNQNYAANASRLWAAILVAALLGIAFYLVIRIAEMFVLRRRPSPEHA